MGNNVSYQNATWGTPSPGIAVKTTEVAGVHTQHVNVDSTVTVADAYAQLGGDGQVARPAPKPPAPAYVTDLNHPQLERDDDAQAHAVIDFDDWLVLL